MAERRAERPVEPRVWPGAPTRRVLVEYIILEYHQPHHSSRLEVCRDALCAAARAALEQLGDEQVEETL